MYLLVLAGHRRIPATVSITADTGAEEDCLWSTGERTTARAYFDQVVTPLARELGIDARFVRARSKDKPPLPSIVEYMKGRLLLNNPAPPIPMFGSRGGRLLQSCTDKWKIAAIKQEARRMGATHLRSAQGIHYGEAARRVKGLYVGKLDGFDSYQSTTKNKTTGAITVIKWMSHYYPLVDLKMDREAVSKALRALNIPYLVSSECDMCPHKDLARWERTSPEKIEEIAELEAQYKGEYFFTDLRKPLKQAIAIWRAEQDANPLLFTEPDFGCGNSYCGV